MWCTVMHLFTLFNTVLQYAKILIQITKLQQNGHIG